MYVSGSERAISEAGLSNDAVSKPGRWPEIPDTTTLCCLTTTSQKVQIDTTGQSKAGLFFHLHRNKESRSMRSAFDEGRPREVEMNTNRNLRIHRTLTVLGLALLIGLFVGSPAGAQVDPNAPLVKDLLGASPSLGLDWAKLFDENGWQKDEIDAAGNPGLNGVPDLIDLYGGFDGIALEDNISAGAALDMSVLAGGSTISECTVYNGTVSAVHDVGNSYMYATLDSLANLVVYFGVERLDQGGDTVLEIELNQDRVRVTTGVPWPMRGARTPGDLLLSINFVGGVVSSVDVLSWDSSTFQAVATYGGLSSAPCNGEPTRVLFCSGAPPIAAPQEVWDAAGNPLAATPPDSFFEIGVNVGNLLGSFVDYTAIQVKTPEDIALGNFLMIGYWAR